MKAIWKALSRKYLEGLIREWFEKSGSTLKARLVSDACSPALAEIIVEKVRLWLLEKARNV